MLRVQLQSRTVQVPTLHDMARALSQQAPPRARGQLRDAPVSMVRALPEPGRETAILPVGVTMAYTCLLSCPRECRPRSFPSTRTAPRPAFGELLRRCHCHTAFHLRFAAAVRSACGCGTLSRPATVAVAFKGVSAWQTIRDAAQKGLKGHDAPCREMSS